jgi:hypothetical protein
VTSQVLQQGLGGFISDIARADRHGSEGPSRAEVGNPVRRGIGLPTTRRVVRGLACTVGSAVVMVRQTSGTVM